MDPTTSHVSFFWYYIRNLPPYSHINCKSASTLPSYFHSALALSLSLSLQRLESMNTEIEMELERLFFPVAVDEAYRPLPYLYLAFLAIWFVYVFSWTINTWKKRHFQVIFHLINPLSFFSSETSQYVSRTPFFPFSRLPDLVTRCIIFLSSFSSLNLVLESDIWVAELYYCFDKYFFFFYRFRLLGLA